MTDVRVLARLSPQGQTIVASALNLSLDVLKSVSIEMDVTPSRPRVGMSHEFRQLHVRDLSGGIRTVSVPVAVVRRRVKTGQGWAR